MTRSSFVEDLSSALAELQKDSRPLTSFPLAWMILANGEAEPDDNIILFGFEQGSKIPVLVAKVPRLPKNAWMLKTEYDRLSDAWQSLGSDAASRLPEPLAMLSLNEQPALIMTYVQGQSLLRTSQKGFWRNSNMVKVLFLEAAQALREIHDRTCSLIQNDIEAPLDFLTKIEKFRQMSEFSAQELKMLDSLSELTKKQAATAARRILLQGDFWHGNIIRETSSEKLIFLDWQYSRWATDTSLDVYLLLLAGALATVPRRSDQERARDAVQVLLDWRTNILPAYLAAYGKPMEYALFPARYGMLMCCIEKVVRSFIDFGSNQRGDSTWMALFTELVKLDEKSEFYDGI